MPVEIRNHQRRVRLSLPRIKKAAEALLQAVGRSDAVLSLLLVDDRQMGRLHQQWMGDPLPTDVLSFSQDPPVKRRSKGGPPDVLGDIVISAETAARRGPSAVGREIIRYLVHGVLHLAGHDHARPREKERMSREARRLAAAVSEIMF